MLKGKTENSPIVLGMEAIVAIAQNVFVLKGGTVKVAGWLLAVAQPAH